VRHRNIFATGRPHIDNVYPVLLCINLELHLSYERVPQLIRDTNSNRSLFGSRLWVCLAKTLDGLPGNFI
jgi:hypothetical protein